MPPSVNSTFIVLIPKVHKPVAVSEFRPINLCNLLYKIIAKTLANRLKKVLPNIISLHQSAFIPGHLIMDNIIVAQETLHSTKTRKKARIRHMALKLDISKTYNRVEWSFLLGILEMLFLDRNGLVY